MSTHPNGFGPSEGNDSGAEAPLVASDRGWTAFLCRHRWVGFVLPFVVYMGVGSLEPIRPLKPNPRLPGAEMLGQENLPEAGQQPLPNPSVLPTELPNPPEAGSGQAKRNTEGKLSQVPPAASHSQAEPLPEANWAGITYAAYPAVYTLKILLTCLAIGLVWPVYREFPFRVSGLAVLVGMASLII